MIDSNLFAQLHSYYLGNIYNKNFWEFESGSISQLEQLVSLINNSVINSFVKESNNTGGFPLDVGFTKKSALVDLNATAHLIPTLSKTSSETVSYSIIDKSLLLMKQGLSSLVNSSGNLSTLTYSYVLVAIASLLENNQDIINSNEVEQFLKSLINKFNKQNNSDFDPSFYNLSNSSQIGYSILSTAKILNSSTYFDTGLEIMETCFSKLPLCGLFDPIEDRNAKNKEFYLLSFLTIASTFIKIGTITQQRKWIDTILPYILKLHRKFEISRMLPKTKYNSDFSPLRSNVDLTSSSYLALIWFSIGSQRKDNLLINSAYKIMDILRGIVSIYSINKVYWGLPTNFPAKSIISPVTFNNISTKCFLEASLKELQIRKL